MSLEDRYSNILNQCIHSIVIWKNLVIDNTEPSPIQTAQLDKIQELTKQYCSIDNDHQKFISALEVVKTAEPQSNLDELLEIQLQNEPNIAPEQNSIWTKLFPRSRRSSISVIEPKRRRKTDTTQYEEIDQSLMLSSQFTAPLDPITKKMITEPLRNKKCHHVYDGSSIYTYLRQSKRLAKCPYVGCENQKVTANDLEADQELGRKITEFLSRQSVDDDNDDSD